MSETRKSMRQPSKRERKLIKSDLKFLANAMRNAPTTPEPMDEIVRVQKKIRRRMQMEGWQPLVVKESFSISELGRNPNKAVRLAQRIGSVAITRRGSPVALLVSRDRMKSILETIEIMANPKAMKAIRRAKAGKGKDYPLSVLDDI